MVNKNKMKRKLIIEGAQEAIEREAKNFGGNASHIILPASFRNKRCFIICLEEDVKE